MTDKNFYSTFSDRHRGSRDLVKARLKAAYLPFIEPLKQLYPECRGLDLGCGRGEWLELLEASGFVPHGIDLDEGMLAGCRQRGFSVERQDAAEAFTPLADESLVVVSGFHLAEHLPLEALQTLMAEAFRVLKPGGLLILETPNPENILVSTSGFFLDPTHQRPIPLHLLSFFAEYYRFARVKVLRLHEAPGIAAKPVVTLLDVLGGVSPDYAVIAQKGGSEAQMAMTGAPFAQEKGVTLEALSAKYDRQVESRLSQTESRIVQTESRLDLAEARIDQAESRALHAEMELQALFASRSWRLTKPLRYAADLLRRLRNRAATGTPSESVSLSPHARRIQEELLAAIERNKKEDD